MRKISPLLCIACLLLASCGAAEKPPQDTPAQPLTQTDSTGVTAPTSPAPSAADANTPPPPPPPPPPEAAPVTDQSPAILQKVEIMKIRGELPRYAGTNQPSSTGSFELSGSLANCDPSILQDPKMQEVKKIWGENQASLLLQEGKMGPSMTRAPLPSMRNRDPFDCIVRHAADISSSDLKKRSKIISLDADRGTVYLVAASSNGEKSEYFVVSLELEGNTIKTKRWVVTE